MERAAGAGAFRDAASRSFRARRRYPGRRARGEGRSDPPAVTDSDSHIEISLAAVDAFARASHDRNPLHVSDAYARSTPFGRRVVHGMLATLVCLGKAPARPGERVARLKVEFTAPLFVGVPYRAEMAVTAERTTVRLHDGKRVTLKLVLEMAHGARTAAPLHVEGLAGEAPRRSLRDLPVGFALDG